MTIFAKKQSTMQEEALQSGLRAVIGKAAAFIVKERESFTPDQVEAKEGVANLVTYVDREAEKILVEGLGKLLPGSGFIAEEGDEVNSSADYRWIIDPIDGTTNFIHGLPVFCISVALQYKEESILGAIYDISRDEYFSAFKGKGAFLNDRRIQVTNCERMADALIATGFASNRFGSVHDFLAVFLELMESTHGVRRIGSAAIDLAWLACGRVDAFYEGGLSPWDVAAGALLVEEAGGKVSDFAGTDNFVFGKQIVSTNGRLHAALLDVLHRYLPA